MYPTVRELWAGKWASYRRYKSKSGYHGKPEYPLNPLENSFSLNFCDLRAKDSDFPPHPNGARPVPSADSFPDFRGEIDSRLYATAYAKLIDTAKQGSAELGLNLVEARKTLKGLTGALFTVGRVIRDIYRVHTLGVKYVQKTPYNTLRSAKRRSDWIRRELAKKATFLDRKKSQRLRAELRQLEHVSSLFLAWRYGVSPLMSDIFSAMHILSGDGVFKDITVRKGASKAISTRVWGRDDVELWYQSTGTCKVLIKCQVSCTNEDLLLANRMGLINPATIAWELIPWSFVLDWFVPVGKFLSNFSGSAGMTFTDSSRTQTTLKNGLFNQRWTRELPNGNWQYYRNGDYPYVVVVKVRQAGPILPPLSVPYGTGIGVERAQNALALAVQLFQPSKKVK